MGCAHLAQVWLTAGACLVRPSQPLPAPWSPPCPFVHAPCFGELCRGDPQVLFVNEPIWLVLSRANLRVRKPQLLLQGRLLLLPQDLSEICSCCPRTCPKSSPDFPRPVPNLLLPQDLSQFCSCCPKSAAAAECCYSCQGCTWASFSREDADVAGRGSLAGRMCSCCCAQLQDTLAWAAQPTEMSPPDAWGGSGTAGLGFAW